MYDDMCYVTQINNFCKIEHVCNFIRADIDLEDEIVFLAIQSSCMIANKKFEEFVVVDKDISSILLQKKLLCMESILKRKCVEYYFKYR